MGHEVELVEKYEYEPARYDWRQGAGLENLALYNPGGLHPVDIGDLIDGRFEVFRKLGAGGFGVVWLCLDKQTNRWRAVKMLAAVHSVGNTNKEIEVLKYLQSRSSPNELARNHIAAPVEHFYINGPNGRHLCFVFPVFGPSASSWSLGLEHNEESTLVLVKEVCRQLAKGVRFLHRNNVVHGDIKPTNVLMKLSGIDELSKDQMNELLGKPETEPVVTTSGTDPSTHAPKHYVKSLCTTWSKKFCTADIAIIDFGESFCVGNPRENWGIPIPYAAPEVVFREAAEGSDWFSSDVWSLACSMYEIRTNWPFFESCSNPSPFVRQLELFFGPLPERYLAAWNAQSSWAIERSSKAEGIALENEGTFSDGVLPVTWKPAELLEERGYIFEEFPCSDLLEAELMQERCRNFSVDSGDARDETITYRYPHQDTRALADLLHGMFKYDSNERLTMEQVCQHPWLDQRTRAQVICEGFTSRFGMKFQRYLSLAFLLGVIFLIIVVISPTSLRINRVGEVSQNPGYCPVICLDQQIEELFLTQCSR